MRYYGHIPPNILSTSAKTGKSFLNLLPWKLQTQQESNKNKVKIGYGCVQNIETVTNCQNMKVLLEDTEGDCRNVNNFPLDEKKLKEAIVSPANIASNQLDRKEILWKKVYLPVVW